MSTKDRESGEGMLVKTTSGSDVDVSSLKPGARMVFNSNPEDDLPGDQAMYRVTGPEAGEQRVIEEVRGRVILFGRTSDKMGYALDVDKIPKYCRVVDS